MAQPYPISRESREEAVFFGDGGAVYGPFDLKIFDIDDVKVWTKASGGNWTIAAPTVAKVDPAAAFSTFTITFAANVALTTKIKVFCARVHERSASITAGTKLSPDALEKELTKQGTILQELRRDLDRSVRMEFEAASPALTVAADLVDDHVLVKSGGRLIDGPSVAQVSTAQQYATDAQQSAIDAGEAATVAQQASIDAQQGAVNALAVAPLAATSLQPIDRTIYPIEKWGVNHLAPDNTAELQLALDSGQPLYAGPHEYIHGPVTFNLCPSLEGAGNKTVFSGKAGYVGDLWTFQGGQTAYGVRTAPVTIKNILFVGNKHIAAAAQDIIRVKNFAADIDFDRVSLHYAKRFGFYCRGSALDGATGYAGHMRFINGSITQCDSLGMAAEGVYDLHVLGNKIAINGVADNSGGAEFKECAGLFYEGNNTFANNGRGVTMYNSGFSMDGGQIDLNTQEGLVIWNTDDIFRGQTVGRMQIARNSRFTPNGYSDIRVVDYSNGLAFVDNQLYGGSDHVYDDDGNPVSTQYVIMIQTPAHVTRKIPILGGSITGGFYRSAFSNDLTKFSNDVRNDDRIAAVEAGKLPKTIGYTGPGTDTRLLINEGRYAVGVNTTTDPTNGTANLPLDLQYSIIDVRRYNDLLVQTAVMPNSAKIYCQTATGIGGTPTWYAWKSATLA